MDKCACFTDCQTAFGGVNCTKLMQMLNRKLVSTGAKRLISKLYMDQSVKVRIQIFKPKWDLK
jgi:hypothetical protein